MDIMRIAPVWVGDFYRFNVELMDGDSSYVVPVGTDGFHNYAILQQAILGKTARLWSLPDFEKRSIENEGKDKHHEDFFWFRDYMISKLEAPTTSNASR